MSKIPEGATHQTLNGGYRKFVNGLWFGYCDGYWVRVRGDSICEFKPLTKIQAEPEWSDEGLPQVGMVIEFMKLNAPPKENGEWTKGDVRYLSDCTIVIGGDRCDHIHHPLNLKYRPYRTPDQVEMETKRISVDRMREIVTDKELKGHGLTVHLEALYGAGLRFVEVTK